jgi:two-component system, sensor histidine kinase and response regulator
MRLFAGLKTTPNAPPCTGRVEEVVMSAIYLEVHRITHWELVPPMRAGADTSSLDAVDMVVLKGFEEIQAEGEPDLVVELIDLYLEDAPRKVASMLEAVAGADGAALRRAAHSLKGGSASLGAFGVAALCEELEQVVEADSFRSAGMLLNNLKRELARVRRAFAAERRRRL